MIAPVENDPAGPVDNWQDLLSPENPFSSAKIIGENIPNDVYCRQEPNVKRGDLAFVMSRGELMEFARCPHRWRAGYKEGGTAEKEWGSLIDALVSGESFSSRFVLVPETYPDAKTGKPKPWNFNATYCDEWRTQHEGKQLIKAAKWHDAEAAHKILLSDKQIASLIECSKRQVMFTAQYDDADTGLTIAVKGLIDFAPSADSDFGRCLADLKTCNTAAPFAWAKSVFEYGYHVQAAMYLDGWNKATGESRDDFRHILQESFAPWEVGKRWLTTDFIAIGRAKYKEALKRYCRALKDDEWEGYDDSGSMVIDGWRETQPLPYMV